MKTCFTFLLSVFLFSQVAFGDTTCVRFAGVGDAVYERPQLANQISTTHFIIHWQSPTTQTYAQNAANYAEYANEEQCGVNGMNWRVPPPDDNRGGDNRYDIYLVNEDYIPNNRGVTQQEIIGNWTEEWAPSFILIINTLTDYNDLKMVVAHEFNHASQLAYTYKDLENGTWFYENTAVWMAEMTYNYAYQYFQRYFGVDPLNYPEYGINTPETISGYYKYAGFLWPKFLAEWRNDDDIIRKIWDRMGIVIGENILNDINIILLSQYSSNLDEAVRYYAEWRYFTGSRDDGFHFNDADDLPTSTVHAQHSGNVVSTSIQLMGYGGTRFIEFSYWEELVEIGFNGDNAYPWIASVIGKRYTGELTNHKINLNSTQDGQIELVNTYVEKFIMTPILNTYISKKNCSYSASWFDGREVFFTNKIGPSNAGGNLKLDNTENIPSGESKWLRFNSTPHNIKTLNERFINSNIYKHNNWNGDVTIFFLNKNFMVQSANNNHDANFIQLYPATIRNVIDGISFNDQLPVWFNDPWYVKDQYDNQSGMGDFIFPQSPYYPTGKYNQTSGGVFLNQGGVPPNLTPPYYSVKVPQTVQNLYLPHTGRYHNFYFMGWTGTEVQFQDASALQTGVVFKDDVQGVDPVVKANLKGTQLSNNQNAFENNGQRKFVRTPDGKMYITYESMNCVWLERSTNDGSSWEIMNNGNPIGNTEGISPCLDYEQYTSNIVLSYQEKIGSSYKLKYVVYSASTGNFRYGDVEWNYDPMEALSYSHDAKMVVCWNGSNEAFFIWKGNSQFLYSLCILNPITTTWYDGGAGIFGNSDYNTPAIYTVKYSSASPRYFHLAYQVSNREIHYRLLKWDAVESTILSLPKLTYLMNFQYSLASRSNRHAHWCLIARG